METFLPVHTEVQDYKQWLCEEFTKRCNKNPHYSMRAFANLLGQDSSTVSQILAGKRKLSPKMVAKIADRLGVDPGLKEAVVKFANFHGKRNKLPMQTPTEIYRQLTLDTFALISDWYHYPILELTFVENFSGSPRWIASKLGITADEANIAIERLLRLKLLEEKDGVLKKSQRFTTNFSHGVTSQALKNFQKHILTKALDAIDNVPQEEKDITGMTMAIDEAKLPEARELIKKFRRDMAKFLETGKQTRVYQLGVQLYPMSRP